MAHCTKCRESHTCASMLQELEKQKQVFKDEIKAKATSQQKLDHL